MSKQLTPAEELIVLHRAATMPELKPCPACGSRRSQLMLSYSPWFTAAVHVLCADCQMQGPIACSRKEEYAITVDDLNHMTEPTGFEAAAIAAWNSLPRWPDYNDVDCAGCPERRRGLLTWTTEPPKVPGWYFQRAMGKEKTQRIAFVSATLSGLHCKCGCSSRPLAHWVGFEWAGPIPPPID